jgi:hypothetical protein
MREFDIRTVGRRWTAEEMAQLHDELPGRLEMANGMLCMDEDQRLLLLGALLEHVGTERAVRLGSLSVWKSAVAQREEDQAWDSMPAVGAERFWLPAYQRLPFKKRLELKPLVKRRRR